MFEQFGLNERLLKALDKLGLSEPTPVQQAMIPAALAGRDIQASAETGSGKTAAFLLPALQRLMERPEPATATRCLVLLPTRELAGQTLAHFKGLAAFTFLKAALITGGSGFREQQALLRKNPELVIGTPGRLREHLQRGSLELGDLEILVLDEADRMLDMGFRDEVMEIVRSCRPQRQSMLLSATLHHGGIGRIAGEVLSNPEVIALAGRGDAPAAIRQQIILADDPGHKRQLLGWLLANEDYAKALVFANTRGDVEALGAFLSHARRADALHGEMTQDERRAVMSGFRDRRDGVMVATDLAARGLDIEGVDLVINFALARSGDEHLHRVGRTGRAGRSGLAISLVAPQEWNRMESFERYLGLRFERREVDAHPARFKGPSAKSGKKKKEKRKKEGAAARKATPKAAQRHRNRKNVGKRRKPAGEGVKRDEGGFAPLKKKQ